MLQQNVTEIRHELARAHLLITLLSIICILLLSIGTALTTEFVDANLFIIADTLLAILALISLGISFVLYSHKK